MIDLGHYITRYVAFSYGRLTMTNMREFTLIMSMHGDNAKGEGAFPFRGMRSPVLYTIHVRTRLPRIRGVLVHDNALYRLTFYLLTYRFSTVYKQMNKQRSTQKA